MGAVLNKLTHHHHYQRIAGENSSITAIFTPLPCNIFFMFQPLLNNCMGCLLTPLFFLFFFRSV